VRQYPIIPCSLCGSQENLQRAQIKAMIREWDRQYPGRIDNMFTAMGSIVPSHMMDRNLYPFTTLQAHGRPDPLGDKAFDEDEDCGSTRPNGGSAATILLHKRLESGEEA
jgi:tRNA 2-thiocytidine biosynthesis protein TtcA